MRLNGPDYISSDVLVIGGGGAGLWAAINARENGASVILASKSTVGLGNNTSLSHAMIAANGFGSSDSAEIHAQDTIKAGCFLGEPCLVRKMTEAAKNEILLLERHGVEFEKAENQFVLRPAPGHSYPRLLQATARRGTGFVFPFKKLAERMGIRFIDKVFISRLLSDGKTIKATAVDSNGSFLVISARAAVLATGGFCQIYLHTNNAVGMTGDGHAMAFLAGVKLRDMEFVQFYPTAINGVRNLPYEEFLFHQGVSLTNSQGNDLLKKYGFQDTRSITRDNLTRAIMLEIKNNNTGITMDLSSITDKELANLRNLLPPLDLLTATKKFNVSPTAHYCMGGLVTNDDLSTSLPGLFACGEVIGGIHGANRLAGNALTDIFCIGEAAGKNAALYSKGVKQPIMNPDEINSEKARLESFANEGDLSLEHLTKSFKGIMWEWGGAVRNQAELQKAVNQTAEIDSLIKKVKIIDVNHFFKLLELKNMLLVSQMVLRSALARTESRGAHYRTDFPHENDDWASSIFINNAEGNIVLESNQNQSINC